MSDAPERIWVYQDGKLRAYRGEQIHNSDIEYVRADIAVKNAVVSYSARIAQLEEQQNAKYWEGVRDDNTKLRARIAALEAMVKHITHSGTCLCPWCTGAAPNWTEEARDDR